MIRLKNIKRKGNIISATVIIVALEEEVFTIKVDVVKRKLISHTHGVIDSYVSMAMAKLINIVYEYGDKLPEVEESVWY